MTLPNVSVLIVNYNGADFVRTAIESARAQRYDGTVEIVVVDNASTDASLDLLHSVPGIELIVSDRNAGFGGGVNLGARAARGEFLALLNPDASAHPDWLAAVVPWMVRGKIDFGSTAVYAGPHPWFDGGRFLRPLGATAVQRGASDWVSGCALVAGSAAFRALGGFDEGFFLYFEDVDLCLRARTAGYRVGVLERPLVDHPKDGRSSANLGRRKAEIGFYSRGRLLAKHTPRAWQPMALTYTALVAPLKNGVSLRHLPAVARAVERGRRSVTRTRAPVVAPRRLRIGVLANTYEPGAGILAGGHLHFIEVVKRWRDVDVVLFAPAPARRPLLGALPDAQFVEMPSVEAKGIGKAVRFLLASALAPLRYRELRGVDAFLVTSQFLPDIAPAAFARRPTAVIIHHVLDKDHAAGGGSNAVAFAGERVSLAFVRAFADAVITSSHFMAGHLRKILPGQRIVVTTSGIDHLHLPENISIGGERSGAVSIARLHPMKGVADAVRAWRLVCDRIPGARLTIIGGDAVPAYGNAVRALAEELGLGNSIYFAGEVDEPDKMRALLSANVFLFPSREEGWGISLAEAMRSGLPAVTYELPVFGEIFTQGRLGAPLGDVDALARHAVTLLTDEPLRRRYAAEALELGRTFTWARSASIARETLQRCVEEGRPRASARPEESSAATPGASG